MTTTFTTTDIDEGELAALNQRFDTESASHIVRWAVDCFHPQLSLMASMTDAVLIDVAARVEADIDVVSIDTGYHFRETLETAETVSRCYGLALRVIDPPPDRPEPWQLDADSCCSASKVAQLDEALVGKEAWISGLRRAESPTRADAPIVARDPRGLVKVNPLANWTDADVERYIADHDVPVNPLVGRGYPSIGCWPCTRPVCDGEHQRAGRWTGSARSECGLHL